MDRLIRITPAGAAGTVTTAEVLELLPEGRYRVRTGGRDAIARGSGGFVYAPGDQALVAGTDHGPVLLNPLGSRNAAPLEVRIHD